MTADQAASAPVRRRVGDVAMSYATQPRLRPPTNDRLGNGRAFPKTQAEVSVTARTTGRQRDEAL